MARLRDKFGSTDASTSSRSVSAENIPAEVREEFRQHSLPVIFWNGLLTFNFRETWLFLFCLLDVPVCHFLFEIIVMGLLWKYVNHRHESFCRQMADKL
jgi:hypothetical protein